MSTKTRPAAKVRVGDVIDFGGQPATVTESHDCGNGQHIYFNVGGDTNDADVKVAPDLPLNVQRPKTKPKPAKVATLTIEPAFNPLPKLTVADLNRCLAKYLGLPVS